MRWRFIVRGTRLRVAEPLWKDPGASSSHEHDPAGVRANGA